MTGATVDGSPGKAPPPQHTWGLGWDLNEEPALRDQWEERPGQRGQQKQRPCGQHGLHTFVRKGGGRVPGEEERVVDRAGAQVEGGKARSGPPRA